VLVSFVVETPLHEGPHFHFPMRDSMNPALLPTREELVAFLRSVHPAVSQHASYWHCHAGQNRSAFGLAAYLHLFRGMTLSDAIEQMRQRRGDRILCNPLFEATLRGWFGTPAEQTFRSPTVEDLRRRWGLPAIPTLDDEPIPLEEAAPTDEAVEILDFSAP
jgi:protein-tyrosine phosphatase